MTVEQLMQPRYIVIADYFYTPYKIGDLITLNGNKSIHLTTIEYTDEFGENVKQHTHYMPSVIDSFPHLFRPLQWWEHREEKDMPDYVKVVNILPVLEVGNVFWVKEKGLMPKPENLSKDASPFYCKVYGYDNRLNYSHFIPATLEEYNNQKQQQ